MISAQQGVEFTTDSDDPVKYGNIKKVYSIWLCTEAAKTRANSIEIYDINRRFLYGSNSDSPRYDILNAIIIYISEKHDSEKAENGLIRMLTYLFDEHVNVADKVRNLKSVYGLNVTKEVESEVTDLCSYADAIENKGIEKGLKALVHSLKVYVKDFDELYTAVIKNEDYKKVSREDVMKYYCETETPVNS
ncbi:hypothetical protein SAMN05216349_10412 [Oribacterium sp. KHPX15]|uniref:hypothetical protein n=1 Tax=Oribacterium sp. KHPX15 TaxID=1855342 RepID=UPI0008973D2B|nr:hypothetical protein [Oribacterium sp. KHPX15]SEA04271.1 hypothetical protein SAMN05216349_10412 [Oribacterium sp. KHPX15]